MTFTRTRIAVSSAALLIGFFVVLSASGVKAQDLETVVKKPLPVEFKNQPLKVELTNPGSGGEVSPIPLHTGKVIFKTLNNSAADGFTAMIDRIQGSWIHIRDVVPTTSNYGAVGWLNTTAVQGVWNQEENLIDDRL